MSQYHEDKCRIKAAKALEVSKSLDQDKIELGYRWLTDGVDKRLIGPSNIEKYLYKGYRELTNSEIQ